MWSLTDTRGNSLEWPKGETSSSQFDCGPVNVFAASLTEIFTICPKNEMQIEGVDYLYHGSNLNEAHSDIYVNDEGAKYR